MRRYGDGWATDVACPIVCIRQRRDERVAVEFIHAWPEAELGVESLGDGPDKVP